MLRAAPLDARQPLEIDPSGYGLRRRHCLQRSGAQRGSFRRRRLCWRQEERRRTRKRRGSQPTLLPPRAKGQPAAASLPAREASPRRLGVGRGAKTEALPPPPPQAPAIRAATCPPPARRRAAAAAAAAAGPPARHPLRDLLPTHTPLRRPAAAAGEQQPETGRAPLLLFSLHRRRLLCCRRRRPSPLVAAPPRASTGRVGRPAVGSAAHVPAAKLQ